MLGRGNTKPFWGHPTQGYHQWHVLRWLAQAAQALAGLPGAAHYDKYQSDTIEEGQEVPRRVHTASKQCPQTQGLHGLPWHHMDCRGCLQGQRQEPLGSPHSMVPELVHTALQQLQPLRQPVPVLPGPAVRCSHTQSGTFEEAREVPRRIG